jgi:hypothetical protein
VLGLDVPQELFQAIEEQRMACEAVIASKDRPIAGAAVHGNCPPQQLCMVVMVKLYLYIQPAGVSCKSYVQPSVSKHSAVLQGHSNGGKLVEQHSTYDCSINALPSDGSMKMPCMVLDDTHLRSVVLVRATTSSQPATLLSCEATDLAEQPYLCWHRYLLC